MTGVDPADLMVAHAGPLLEGGQLRATAYTEACLRRVDERGGDTGAWRLVDRELALQQAQELDGHRLSGSPIGSLHGIPVAVQDIFDTDDLPTAHGTPLDEGRRPAKDATAVARLRGAGAVILGKADTTDLGWPRPGRARNPADHSRSAGGAGGGAAAAVAAGMAPLALAMQSAGDIIQAASFCGVVGFKPSHGLVPRTGALGRSPLLDTVGVFGRCVEDVALVLDALAGGDPSDPDTSRQTPPRALELSSSDPPLAPSFAHVPQGAWTRAEPTTAAGFDELDEAIGERWETWELPDTFADGIGAHRTLMLVDAARGLEHYAGLGALDDELRAALEEARAIPAVNYLSAMDWRDVLYTGVSRIFSRYEVIVTPAAAGQAPVAGEPGDNGAFGVLWTLLGLPAVSLPLMEGPDGLPVGVQLVGRRGQDGRLLRSARYLCEFIAAQA